MEKAFFNWSSGKDSALALYYAIHTQDILVERLFSVVKADCGRVAMHETSVNLLQKQAEAIGIPLTVFYYDTQWTQETYQAAMKKQMDAFREQGITTALYGDICLEPLRMAREQNCGRAGMKAGFPIWNIPQKELMEAFLGLGFKAVITCIDSAVLSETVLGKVIDNDFLRALPPNADLCGEKGEYHSFVFDGPIFKSPVPFEVKKKYDRDYPDLSVGGNRKFWYLELG